MVEMSFWRRSGQQTSAVEDREELRIINPAGEDDVICKVHVL
jgi:hypothetical protein